MKEILFNKMYTGSYTSENIGQEIINNFKSDNGKQYLYVTPHGGVGIEHNDKIEYILFTSSVSSNQFEILAVAKGLKQINCNGSNGDLQSHKEQEEFIKNENITYGGKLLNQIFISNPEYETANFITFEAETVVKPNKKVYVIQSKENSVVEKEESIELKLNITLGHMTAYIAEENGSYDIIKEVIENKSYWKADGNSVVNIQKYKDIEETNFLKLIKKEDDETIFTNMLYYYFKNDSNLFNEFIKEYLEINDSEPYEVEREKSIADDTMKNGRMDLWATNKNNVIIVENKIKSGLNGIDKENNLSQLDNYYRYAEEVADGRNIKGLIFVPNYNMEEIENEKNKYKIGDKYVTIPYSYLYSFFYSKKEEFFNDKYYKDFVNALLKHTLTPKEAMERKFVCAIKEIK